jgi:hypothetical protein
MKMPLEGDPMFILKPESVRLMRAALAVTANIANPAPKNLPHLTTSARVSPRASRHRRWRATFLRLFAPTNN